MSNEKLTAALHAVEEAKAKIDAAEAEKRPLSAEEDEFVERAFADYDSLKGEADVEAKKTRLDSILKAAGEKQEEKVERAQFQAPEVRIEKTPTLEDEKKAWNDYFHFGKVSPMFTREGYGEKAAGTEASAAGGGYLMTPLLSATLWEDIGQDNPMLSLSTEQQIAGYQTIVSQAQSHGSAAWTGEAAGYGTADEAYAQVAISAFKLTARTLQSEELVLDSFFDLESHIRKIFTRLLAEGINAGLTVGTGTTQPDGIIPQTNSGGNTLSAASGETTTISPDEVFSLVAKVPPQYRTKQATFMCNDGTVFKLRKLKDADGRYLWDPSYQAGTPDRLVGYPLVVNQDVVAMTASAKSLFFGRPDSYLAIRPAQPLSFRRANELYAETGQVGFYAAARIGGKLTGPVTSVAVFINAAS